MRARYSSATRLGVVSPRRYASVSSWMVPRIIVAESACSARDVGGLSEMPVASFLDDPRHTEEVVDAIRGVGEHLLDREARARLVVAHDVELRHRVRRRLDASRVHRLQ